MMTDNPLASLPPQAFARRDEAPDQEFYRFERLVTHIDSAAVAAVTHLYVPYPRVAGLGMNARELAQNPRLTDYLVQNLNELPHLPYADAEFDAAGICVSVQYLTQPADVFKELARVLRPGAPLVVTFSNRCFPDKAVYAWQALDDNGHVALVQQYFAAGGFGPTEVFAHRPKGGDPLFGIVGRAGNAQSLPTNS
jgi:SAM-dependent methyltransferase